MSKTWRREERAKHRGGRPAVRKVDFTRRSEQPEVVTEEWALKRMAEHVNYVLEVLISAGEVEVSDKADYAAMINRAIIKAVPAYDPDRRDEDGRTTSAVHFFTVVVDNAAFRVRRFNERMRNGLRTVPIADGQGEGGPWGAISQYSDLLSDRGRTIRDIELRMDVRTLFGMLTEIERYVLSMRLSGHSYNEIGDSLGCTRQYILKDFVPRIQLVARDCGFFPASERRG